MHLFPLRLLHLFIFASFINMPSLLAEYRAFRLTITNEQTGKSRSISSTMDHLQYPQYYPLQQNEIIEYEDSWMCWKESSHFQPICPKPIDPKANSEPILAPQTR